MYAYPSLHLDLQALFGLLIHLDYVFNCPSNTPMYVMRGPNPAGYVRIYIYAIPG